MRDYFEPTIKRYLRRWKPTQRPATIHSKNGILRRFVAELEPGLATRGGDRVVANHRLVEKVDGLGQEGAERRCPPPRRRLKDERRLRSGRRARNEAERAQETSRLRLRWRGGGW